MAAPRAVVYCTISPSGTLTSAFSFSRTTRAIERRGEEGARREIDMTSIFGSIAERQVKTNMADLGKNDDELRKVVASRAYADGAYPFDIL